MGRLRPAPDRGGPAQREPVAALLEAALLEQRALEAELRRQNEELARALLSSERLVAVLGHDLRNPLQSILTGAMLLENQADEAARRIAVRVRTSATRMARLVEQMLDYTRIHAGRGLALQLRRLDLTAVCRLVADELSGAEGRAPVMLAARGNCFGRWDPDRMTQLASHLVGNAVAHGASGRPVSVTVDGSRGDVVCLDVRNAGVVPRERLGRIYRPLAADDRPPQGSSGLGLGLYICREIAEAHGGHIDLTSSERDGTRVIVRLPRELPGPPPPLPSGES